MYKRAAIVCGLCLLLLGGQSMPNSLASHHHRYLYQTSFTKHRLRYKSSLVNWIYHHHSSHKSLYKHGYSRSLKSLLRYGQHYHWSRHALRRLNFHKLHSLKKDYKFAPVRFSYRHKKTHHHMIQHSSWDDSISQEDSTADLGSTADNQGSYNLNVIRQRLLTDTNEDRLLNQMPPLITTEALQKDADYRNPHVQNAMDHLNDYYNYPHNTSNPMDNWVHGVDTHTTGSDYFNSHHYHWHHYAANAGGWSYGYTKYNVNPDYTQLRYNNNDLNGIADNINDVLMNHDNTGGNNNGHRANILSPYYKYIGIGVTYNPQTKIGTFNEQFDG